MRETEMEERSKTIMEEFERYRYQETLISSAIQVISQYHSE